MYNSYIRAHLHETKETLGTGWIPPKLDLRDYSVDHPVRQIDVYQFREFNKMSKKIEITTTMKNDSAVIKINGDVTAVTGGSLEKAYLGDGVSRAPKVVLNFDKGCYINSGGLAFLINIAIQAREKGQKICVTGLTDHFQKIFHMVGLTRCLEIVASEEIALKG